MSVPVLNSYFFLNPGITTSPALPQHISAILNSNNLGIQDNFREQLGNVAAVLRKRDVFTSQKISEVLQKWETSVPAAIQNDLVEIFQGISSEHMRIAQKELASLIAPQPAAKIGPSRFQDSKVAVAQAAKVLKSGGVKDPTASVKSLPSENLFDDFGPSWDFFDDKSPTDEVQAQDPAQSAESLRPPIRNLFESELTPEYGESTTELKGSAPRSEIPTLQPVVAEPPTLEEETITPLLPSRDLSEGPTLRPFPGPYRFSDAPTTLREAKPEWEAPTQPPESRPASPARKTPQILPGKPLASESDTLKPSTSQLTIGVDPATGEFTGVTDEESTGPLEQPPAIDSLSSLAPVVPTDLDQKRIETIVVRDRKQGKGGAIPSDSLIGMERPSIDNEFSSEQTVGAGYTDDTHIPQQAPGFFTRLGTKLKDFLNPKKEILPDIDLNGLRPQSSFFQWDAGVKAYLFKMPAGIQSISVGRADFVPIIHELASQLNQLPKIAFVIARLPKGKYSLEVPSSGRQLSHNGSILSPGQSTALKSGDRITLGRGAAFIFEG